VGSDHHRDHLAHVADLVLRQRELRARGGQTGVRDQHREAFGEGALQVGVREHAQDTGEGSRVGDIDVRDPRMREVRSHEGRVRRAGFEVRREPASASDQPVVLPPGDPFAEQPRRHRRRSVTHGATVGKDLGATPPACRVRPRALPIEP
jgi:hypothetical protein